MSILKIALVQHKAVPNDTNANLRLALHYISEASHRGADLVLFPGRMGMLLLLTVHLMIL